MNLFFLQKVNQYWIRLDISTTDYGDDGLLRQRRGGTTPGSSAAASESPRMYRRFLADSFYTVLVSFGKYYTDILNKYFL